MADRETRETDAHSQAASSEVDTPISAPVESIPQTLASFPDTDGVLRSIDRIGTQVEELSNAFRARLSYDKAKEEAFDRLYTELDATKKSAAQDSIRPLLLDLVLLYDRMEQMHQQAASGEGLVSAEAVASFVGELLEVLFRRDVSLIESQSGCFDSTYQKAVGVLDVQDPADHQKVDRVVRRGFKLVDRILRPEEVVVRRFVPKSSQPSASDATEGDERKEGSS